MRTILALIQPFDTATNARVDVRVGDSPSPIGLGLGGYEWEAAFTQRPTLTVELMSIDMKPGLFAGKASFVVQLRNVENVPDIVRKDFQGAPVMLWSADDLSWARRKLEFTGFVTSATLDPDMLTVSLDCDTSTKMLQVPFLWDHFDGSGGLGGDASMRGAVKPAGLGVVKGVEPVWFDQVNNVGMLDGYGNLVSVQRALEGASAWGAAVNDYPTYAALVAAIVAKTVAPGQWATCIAQGLVGLGAPPHGVMMFDCTFGYGTPGTAIPRILEAHASIPAGEIDLVSMAAVDAALNALFAAAPAIGYWTKDPRQVDDLVSMIAGSCNASLIVSPQGLITISRMVASAPIATLDRSGSVDPRVLNWKSAGSIAPFYLLKARAARPARLLTRDEVNFYDTFVPLGNFNIGTVYRSGNTVFKTDGSEWLYINATAAAGHTPPAATYPPAAFAADAWWQQIGAGSTYADGSPIDNFKPQELGANKTETRTAAAIAGQGILATSNVTSLGSTGTVVRQDGVTHVTDATAITSLGTAAAIAGQGTGATANMLAQLNAAEGAKLTGIAAGATAGINVMPNADFSDGSNFYTLGGGVRTAGAAGDPAPFFIRYAAALTLTGPLIPVPPNAGTLFVGWYERHSGAGGITTQQLFFYNAAGAFISAGTVPMAAPSYSTGSTAWLPVSGPISVPAGGVAMQLSITPQPPGGGVTFDVTLPFVQVAANSADVTAVNTAAAIAGQGALATANYSYYGTGGTIKEAFGGVDATLTNFKTGLGTAAAIAAQGSYATLSQTYFGDGLLRETSGGATATLINFKTSSGTAAAIAGQGTGATANNLTGLNATEGAKLGGIAAGATAGVTLSALSTDYSISGNSITKTGVTGWNNNSQVVSIERAVGACVFSFLAPTTATPHVVAGFDTSAAARFTPYTNMAGVNFNGTSTGGDGKVYLFDGVGLIGTGLTWAANDIVQVVYDNSSVYALLNGARIGGGSNAISVGSGNTYYVKVALYEQGLTLPPISFDRTITPWKALAGTGLPADNADVTSTHTAASIAGQGTGATANNIAQLNATEGTKFAGIATGADVTIQSQFGWSPIPDVQINLTSAGAIAAGQLPKTLAAPWITKGGTPITGVDNLLTYALTDVAAALGTVTVDNTGGAATKGQVTLANTPTALTGAGAFTLTVSYNTVPIAVMRVNVTILQASQASGGSSGGTTGGIGDTVGNAYVQVGSTIAGVSVSGGKSIRCSYGGNYNVQGFNHTAHATVKFRYAPAGTTTYTDIGTPATGTLATLGPSGSFSQTTGSVSYNQNATPATGTYDVSMWAESDGWNISFDGFSAGSVAVS